MNKYHIILSMLFLTLGMIVFAENSSAEVLKNDTKEIRVVGVKMDAEWCGKCRVLNPKLNSVMPEFMGEDILFLKFNMTDEFTIHQSAFLAERLNLASLFEEYRGQTGFMVLLNAKTGEQLHTLRSDQTEVELENDIRATLQSVK